MAQNIQIKYCNYFFENYKKNVHSQNGEDGVIEEMLKRLDINKGFVCEIGIDNIEKYSNTFNLIKKGFNALLIEGNTNKYNEITKVIKNIKNVKAVNSDVNSDITIDSILKKEDVPNDLDILSINNSGNEYNIWKSLQKYKPKILIIKINSGINPTNNEHIHSSKCDGTSFFPMYNLGTEKGYKFVLHTGNMVFVRNDLYERLHITYTNPLENFFPKWFLEQEQSQNKNKNSFINNSQMPSTDIKAEKKKLNINNPLINKATNIL